MNTCKGCRYAVREDMEEWLAGGPFGAPEVCMLCFLWLIPKDTRANYEPIPDIRARLTAMATECKDMAEAVAGEMTDPPANGDPWLIATEIVSEAGDALRDAANAVGKALDAPKEGGERFVGLKPLRDEP